MGDIGMKTAIFLAVALATFTSIPLLAQQVDASTPANDSAKVTYAPAAAGFGDEAASHAWEMSTVTGELQGKLDSKTAKVGDRVVLKTTDKVQTSDGIVIPRGSRLVGHVTEVQAYDKEHGSAQMGIAFDRAELKSGQSLAIHTLIRAVNPSGTGANLIDSGDVIGAALGGGRMGGGRSDGMLSGGGGTANAAGGPANGDGSQAGGIMARTANASGGLGEQTGAMVNSNASDAVHAAGHGDWDSNIGAHAAAAARAIPRPTGIPDVMLAGNSTASGLLLAFRKDIQFESGTEMQLGVVVDR
jgi:hypothetical protein